MPYPRHGIILNLKSVSAPNDVPLSISLAPRIYLVICIWSCLGASGVAYIDNVMYPKMFRVPPLRHRDRFVSPSNINKSTKWRGVFSRNGHRLRGMRTSELYARNVTSMTPYVPTTP
ncbi:hypothetical protein GWI33_004403 [Rhynchophorus ferrugineus]|uniref:Uncharacterized protein n=1 Tax=Rhynchophorus ferrugineus TaxID=354439 RepID=A0A834MEN7_RHYFE|nr:hypothetical protein GWI33_004403 [Rhynchophorus ferrugineus]